ncbi:threonine aldolase family protein [Enterococcus sp. LJL51]|uniref:threonine aldolase family protein n=1 Tax=Enterococcus sp. LJL51 TaxID=3416656 RepID=UPI003CEB179B
MTEQSKLTKSYDQTHYRLSHHGERNVSVLKQVIDQLDGEQSSDIYGNGEVIEQFQEKMTGILGKEAAVFFPSGTMAQQIALRIWSDRKQGATVGYHPLSHLEIHEEGGLKELHHIYPILLGNKERLITLEDIQAVEEPLACILIELPQREIGGQLPTFEELQAISGYCKAKGIKLHLDGARLWECLPYYDKTAEEICALFDSVYVSFYKGIGGIAGAILAGEAEFIEESKIWKRRHGGDLISLYPYIVTADYYYEQRIGSMPDYVQAAKKVAELFNQCSNTKTVPKIPVANMFHVHFSKTIADMEQVFAEVQEKSDVGFTLMLWEEAEGVSAFELSIGESFLTIPEENLKIAFDTLKTAMN